MTRLAVIVLSIAAVAVAQRAQTFTGVITDSMCPSGNHSLMRMGPTDADCATACVEAHGATFVLADRTSAYELSDQKAAQAFAGQRVRVTGTLDDTTHRIQVESITAAK